MTKLNQKTALVTGGSRGIGRATALTLAATGASVLVHYGRSVAEADEVVALIRAAGGEAQAIGANLAAPNGPADLLVVGGGPRPGASIRRAVRGGGAGLGSPSAVRLRSPVGEPDCVPRSAGRGRVAGGGGA